MNNKSIGFRSVIAVIVIVVFALSIYPLYPKNFLDTFRELAEKRLAYDQGQISGKIKTDMKDSDSTQSEAELRETYEKQLQEKRETLPKLIDEAQRLIDVDKMFPSRALEDAAKNLVVDLTQYVRGKNVINNGDVISLVRKEASSSIRLGLDLNGGVEFLLELVPDKEKEDIRDQAAGKDEKAPEFDAEYERYRDIAVEILRNRLESQNIYESEISPSGARYISLRAPIVTKDEKQKLLKIIQMSAKLQFCIVHKDNAQLVNDYLADPKSFLPPVGYRLMTTLDEQPGKEPRKDYYIVKIQPEMTGKTVVNAQPTLGQFGQREIQLRFNHEGAVLFGDVTTKFQGQMLAIVLDGKLYSAPVIREPILQGNAVISGSFSRDEAQNVSNALVSGSLPVKINVDAMFDTDPTLGADSVKSGALAGLIAMAFVILFMAFFYRRAGLVADVALLVNVVLVLGALAAFEATLTLPGIAGIILTIGMAVDANVLIFERIREELRNGKSLLSAIDNGFNRAFITIVDANLTTLLVALILMWQGTGAIKGFAVTLSIGILTSMFTALFLSRLIFDIMSKYRPFSVSLKMLQVFGKVNIDFLGKRKICGTLSVVLIILSIVAFGVRGSGMLGIDFTGGTQMMLGYRKAVPTQEIERVLTENNYRNPKVTWKQSLTGSETKMLEIVLRQTNVEQEAADMQGLHSPMSSIVSLLNERFPEAGFTPEQESTLGGLIGRQFKKAAIISMALAVLGMILYISIRFEFAYAMAAMIAIAHDVIIATGIYVMLGRELALPVIAALLTIVGYSINDTIVVFDRIREDIEFVKNKSYHEIINMSVNETLSRTTLTSFTTLLVVVVLFLLGGPAINDFALVMIVGIVVGTYSSIFIASPIVAIWHKRIDAKRETAVAKAAAATPV